MAISESIEYAALEDLYLDPLNPRLGRHSLAKGLSQDSILEQMQDWTLDELAVSFAESGFWTQEALVVVKERIDGAKRRVVIEGNRRLAALKLLASAIDGNPLSPKWSEIARSVTPTKWSRLQQVPHVLAGSRREVQSYLGFRHVTGIKEWEPAEKAQFIAHLIDDEKLSYDQVRKRIGSKAPTVRQNYISYRILLQMEREREDISIEKVEDRFSVLYLSLRTKGVQTYLHIDVDAGPQRARRPIPKTRLSQLANFALWLFGNDDQKPIVRDSRDTDNFGQILESKKAVDYLENTANPSFQTAFRIAGGDESETIRHVDTAAYEIEEALKTAHLHKKSARLQEGVTRLGRDTTQLIGLFPAVLKELAGEGE